MRHRKSGRHLNRSRSHYHAMFRNMSASLVKHELIRTTLPKAKELRSFIEPLITPRQGGQCLQPQGRLRAASRSGVRCENCSGNSDRATGSGLAGTCGIMKCGYRSGDKAPMAYVELIDRPTAGNRRRGRGLIGRPQPLPVPARSEFPPEDPIDLLRVCLAAGHFHDPADEEPEDLFLPCLELLHLRRMGRDDLFGERFDFGGGGDLREAPPCRLRNPGRLPGARPPRILPSPSCRTGSRRRCGR